MKFNFGDQGGPGPFTALSGVIAAAAALVGKEIALAKAEFARAVDEAKGAVIQLVIAAVLAMVGLNVLAGAVVAAIIELGLSPLWAAALVGVVFLGLALGFAQSARSKLQMSNLAPNRSKDNLKRDLDTLSAAVKGEEGRNA